VASGFNFFEVLSQFKDVLKFVVRYYPMVKSVMETLDKYIDNPLLDKILYFISKAEGIGLNGAEKKKFVMENAKIPEDKADVIDKIVAVINNFK
jgi:hypothetical protein